MEIFAFIAVILLVRQEGHLASKKYHSSNQQKFPPKPFLLSRFCSFMIFMSCNQYQYFYNIHVPVDLALKHLSFCKTWLIFLLFVDHLIFSIHVISWFLIILLFFFSFNSFLALNENCTLLIHGNSFVFIITFVSRVERWFPSVLEVLSRLSVTDTIIFAANGQSCISLACAQNIVHIGSCSGYV